MRPQDREVAQRLETGLLAFDRQNRPLPGIRDPVTRAVLIEQMLESIRRVAYVSVVRKRDLSNRRADPNDALFDPLRAAMLSSRQGLVDEAFWLLFLFVHFGKHAQAGWRYAREVYGRLGDEGRWDWVSTAADPTAFRDWLVAGQEELKSGGPGFGNHRKYQSLDASSPTGTGAAVESYVRWVGPPRNHEELMTEAIRGADGDPRKAFDYLYQDMNVVVSFGRLARFDYLTMVGKLKLAPIEPGSTYMGGATGPIRGARLLLGTRASSVKLDKTLVELDDLLGVGMQVLEDALCNWEKSPASFKPFRG